MFVTQLAIKCTFFHLTQCLLLQYLGKADRAKYVIKHTKTWKKHPYYRS